MKLRTVQKGEPITAALFNALVERVNALAPIGGRNTNVRVTPNGMIIDNVARTGRGVERFAFALATDVLDDYLECVFYDPVTDTTYGTVNVAKPHLLQRTPWDGKTVPHYNGDYITYTYDATTPERKREADDGSTTETQVITPDYIINTTYGDHLRIERVNVGFNDASGNPILWQDCNRGARAWAREVA